VSAGPLALSLRSKFILSILRKRSTRHGIVLRCSRRSTMLCLTEIRTATSRRRPQPAGMVGDHNVTSCIGHNTTLSLRTTSSSVRRRLRSVVTNYACAARSTERCQRAAPHPPTHSWGDGGNVLTVFVVFVRSCVNLLAR